jgi:hypothetical protein
MKWGPALLPAPNAPSEGSAGVQSTWSRPREGLAPRFSILAHQLRRRFLPGNSLRRGARLFYSTALARKPRLPFVRPGLALEPRSEDRTSVQNHPMFRGPSWDSLCRVPLCSLKFRGIPRTASPDRKPISSGASPSWPRQEPESSSHCLPAEIGPLVPCRALLAVAGLPSEAGTAVPITRGPCTSHPSRGSEIFGNEPVDNGDFVHKARSPRKAAMDARPPSRDCRCGSPLLTP